MVCIAFNDLALITWKTLVQTCKLLYPKWNALVEPKGNVLLARWKRLVRWWWKLWARWKLLVKDSLLAHQSLAGHGLPPESHGVSYRRSPTNLSTMGVHGEFQPVTDDLRSMVETFGLRARLRALRVAPILSTLA